MTSAARSALDENNKTTGEFKRSDSAWRNWIKDDPDARFPAQANRYHLYVAYACPWAHRTLMVRAMKGLEDVISVTIVHPIWQPTRPEVEGDTHTGWMFGRESEETLLNSQGNGGPFPSAYPKNSKDPYGDATFVRDIYDRAGDTDGKYSVPIMWDTVHNTIVNNESSEIIRMLNSEFNKFAKNPTMDLYPESLKESIDAVNSWVYPGINNGVYRCGFAKSQAAYDQAIDELTEAFDKVDGILQKQRYIADKNSLSEADVRLFVTLLRFDEVYTVYFKTNTRSVAHTPAILNYCRDVYQTPGVAATVDMEQIKTHYYASHPTLNHYSIVPRGNSKFIELLEEPHNREAM